MTDTSTLALKLSVALEELHLTADAIVIVAVDMSGGIRPEAVNGVLPEIGDALASRGVQHCELLTFDTQILDAKRWSTKSAPELVWTGAGGTDVTQVFMRAEKCKAALLIVLSDLYFGKPQGSNVPPTIWVNLDPAGFPHPALPFGTVISV